MLHKIIDESITVKQGKGKEPNKLQKEKLRDLYKFQDKEPTRDTVKVLIRNFLWDEKTGLPVENYSQNDVYKKAEAVFYHVFRAYPTVPSPYYVSVASQGVVRVTHPIFFANLYLTF